MQTENCPQTALRSKTAKTSDRRKTHYRIVTLRGDFFVTGDVEAFAVIASEDVQDVEAITLQ